MQDDPVFEFPGFYGSTCDISIPGGGGGSSGGGGSDIIKKQNSPACDTLPCQNGGTCLDVTDGYACSCVSGFYGKTCELSHAAATCLRDICTNDTQIVCAHDNLTDIKCSCGAMPVSAYGNCSCPNHYYGEDCTTYCREENSCMGHYTCDPSTGEQICMDGYSGIDCIDRVSTTMLDAACPNSEPCKNAGTCFNGSCCCVLGFTGSTCGIEVNECDSDPCQNGATCSDELNSYICSCAAGKF